MKTEMKSNICLKVSASLLSSYLFSSYSVAFFLLHETLLQVKVLNFSALGTAVLASGISSKMSANGSSSLLLQLLNGAEAELLVNSSVSFSPHWFKIQDDKATFVPKPFPSLLWPYLFSWAKDVLPATSIISSLFFNEKKFCHQEQVSVFSSAFGRAGIVKGREDSAKDWNDGCSSWFTGLLTRIVIQMQKLEATFDSNSFLFYSLHTFLFQPDLCCLNFLIWVKINYARQLFSPHPLLLEWLSWCQNSESREEIRPNGLVHTQCCQREQRHNFGIDIAVVV